MSEDKPTSYVFASYGVNTDPADMGDWREVGREKVPGGVKVISTRGRLKSVMTHWDDGGRSGWTVFCSGDEHITMGKDLEIPWSHWPEIHHGHIPHWEKTLRKNIAEEPDPSRRFTTWLQRLQAGEYQDRPWLIFLEQPYLQWAKSITKTVSDTAEKARKDERAAIVENILRDGEEDDD